MNRGDIYRVARPPGNDPKKYRYFVIVSRDALIETGYSTIICAPVYTRFDGLTTQVPVGQAEGLTHPSSIHCDGLVSLPKRQLTNWVGRLSHLRLPELSRALAHALAIYADEIQR